eukprot:m.111332 g.111332  ORF g.111332 m.111332 type:complete len:376 (-) comp28113_c0_seq1:81-1208(-)
MHVGNLDLSMSLLLIVGFVIVPASNALVSDDLFEHRERTVQLSNAAGTCDQRRAIVSMMWGHCKPGVVATAAILQQADTKAEHIVYLDPDMKECSTMLKAANVTVEDLPQGDTSLQLPSKIWSRRARKFSLFNLKSFKPGDCILTLDTDVVPTGNVDEMFAFPTKEMPFWASSDPNPTMQLNSGVMVFRIYEGMYEEIKQTLAYISTKTKTLNAALANTHPGAVPTNFGDGDQAYINFHFGVVKGYYNIMSARYNVVVPQLLESVRGRSSTLAFVKPDYVKMLHYTNGGFTSRCECVSRGKCNDVETIRWRNLGVSMAVSIVAKQCCALASFVGNLSASGVTIPRQYENGDAFHCDDLRGFHANRFRVWQQNHTT